jgi:hypothetical protein
MPLRRRSLWMCLQECFDAPDPFKCLETCVERLRAEGTHTPQELDELENDALKILGLLFPDRRVQ